VATRPSFRVISYALAIAVPTLVLLGLGLLSVRRQQQAIVQLELANLRLTADQAARNLAARLPAPRRRACATKPGGPLRPSRHRSRSMPSRVVILWPVSW
jgi:hypothetical protein